VTPPDVVDARRQLPSGAGFAKLRGGTRQRADGFCVVYDALRGFGPRPVRGVQRPVALAPGGPGMTFLGHI
jgi:hypothetical protein